MDDAERFFVLARAGFSAPRKQLRNALSGGLKVTPDEAERLLTEAGIEASRARPDAVAGGVGVAVPRLASDAT